MTKKIKANQVSVNENLFIFFTMFSVLFIVLFVITLVIIIPEWENLKSQLSECQEKVPVCSFKNGYWGFRATCSYWDWKVIDKHHYKNLEECKIWIARWLEHENCEVIK